MQSVDLPVSRHDGESATRAPRVSVGLPVFNSDRYLADALESLLGQTYGDFELVICDNGSTDQTEAICRRYADRDSRIIYHRSTHNRGAIWNFNRVFEFARGEYFKWAAADDVCAPTFLARCVEMLDRDPSLICCHAKTQKIDAHGAALDLPDPTDGGIDPIKYPGRRLNGRSHRAHRRFHDVLLSSGWSVRCYGVIRSSALRQVGRLEPYFGSEKILMAKLSLIGAFVEVPERLFFQRVHTAAASHLGSLGEQQSFVDPSLETARKSPWLLYLRDYLRTVQRADVSLADRVWCVVWIGRYLFQVGKWKRILQAMIRGTGSGGSSRHLLRSANQNSRHATKTEGQTAADLRGRPDVGSRMTSS